MEHFLICRNPRCRYIVNLREGAQALERSIDECPKCGYPAEPTHAYLNAAVKLSFRSAELARLLMVDLRSLQCDWQQGARFEDKR
jgi:hypothetical protein